jgi:lysophospholipase L1-like esterase
MAPRPTIVLLGDSLTQLSFEGWGAKLAHVYQRRCDVLNRGYSGYNTKMYLERVLPRLLGREDEEEKEEICWTSVALCVVFFGANDAVKPDVDPQHHVPLDVYTRNLIAMIDRIHRHAQKRLKQQRLEDKLSNADSNNETVLTNTQPRFLLVTPPPVHHGQRLAHQRQKYGDKATGVLERTNDLTGLYAYACVQKVGTELDVPVLNLYDEMTKRGNVDELLCDGLHFSSAGHEFVARQLLGAIHEHFPDLEVFPDPVTGQFCNSGSRCMDLPPNGPYHDEIS